MSRTALTPYGLLSDSQITVYTNVSAPVIDTGATQYAKNEKVKSFTLTAYNQSFTLTSELVGMRTLQLRSLRYSVVNPEQKTLNISITTEDSSLVQLVMDNKESDAGFLYTKQLYLASEDTLSLYESPEKSLVDRVIDAGFNVNKIYFTVRINGLAALDISPNNPCVIELAFSP